MLVINRKEGQRVIMGPGGAVSVVVKQISRNGVRLVVHAPPDFPVYREEIYQQITGMPIPSLPG